ncbi:MAG: type II toxin-antitoxin system RelE/ParE family toxin [Pyrinomonadaceae bacterium]|nr:type II toxin-antitoxin system RelE/ParE family toxin [Pyrinomonadaceae bacterium]
MLKFTEKAQADLTEIFVYLAEKNVDVATKTVNQLFEKFALLENNPKLGRERNELLLNLRGFPHKNYIIFYFPITDGIEIFRVLHASRNIDSVFDEFFEGLNE